MRAVRITELGEPPVGRLEEVPDPVAGPGELLVEVRAVPVNYVDLVTAHGRYQFSPGLPYTPGKGPAGVVRAVGDGVAGFRVGDRVLAMAEYGGYGELVVVGEHAVFAMPDSLSFVDAAAMSLGFDTAWMALRERARMSEGDRVLVLGASGAVGGAAVALARALGAETVIAGITSMHKESRVRALGADHVVDLGVENLRDGLRDRVRELTGGHGADVVVDPLGGDVFDAAIRAVAWRGRHVVIGFAAGRIPTLKVNYLMLKNIEVSGVQISDYRTRMPELVRECFREVFDLHAQGRIAAPPSETLPLSRWQDGMRSVDERTAGGRVVLVPGR